MAETVPTPTTASGSMKRERSASVTEDLSPSSTKRINTGQPAEDGNDASKMAENGTVKTESTEAPAQQDTQMTESQTTTTNNATPSSAAPAATGAAALPPTPVDPTGTTAAAAAPAKDPATQTINMRCLIVTQDASIIIGKGGKHVNEIREKSSARVNISESIPGNPERILSVQGPLDAVSKAFGLIVRRINDEPFDQPSLPGSRAVTIKFIIPNSRMGSVIGKGGSKIKEIQEASGARLNASESMLPGSTERVLSVAGVADAVHIAVYYIGTILLEYQDTRGGAGGGMGASSTVGQYRQGGGLAPRGSVSGGAGGGAAYGGVMGGQAAIPAASLSPGAAMQQFWIPNDLVGSIIGKGGVKINEIRTQSQCQIRVTDPGTPAQPGGPVNPNERLVIIQGQPMQINVAVSMLHQRLEVEKMKKSGAGAPGAAVGMMPPGTY